MTEIDFIDFLKTCIDSLESAKGIKLEVFSTKRASEQNYQVVFKRLDTGDHFEIDFFWPAVEKLESTEEIIKNGKLVVKKLYQNVRLNTRM